MDERKVRLYLERIGITGPVPAGAEGLRQLQNAHLRAVPYENLDILAGREMPLDEDSLFDKIVTRHRGGYCFELNGLFGALLSALGYRVDDHFARFLLGEPAVPMRRHRVLVAHTEEGSYLMDVGVGVTIPRDPLLLEEGRVQGSYEVKREPFYGWVVYDRGRRLYSFDDQKQLPVDFEAAHFWCRYSPDSPFTRGNMLAIRTGEGRITLDGSALRFHRPGSVEERILTPGEEAEALERWFGIRPE